MTSNIDQGGWYSKKSMMRDLARATGIRHIDDTCFVVGEIPPPRQSYIEDVAEIVYMYGDIPENVPNEARTPDLNGIQEMLRMVDNETVDRSKPNTDLEGPCTDNILTITKLNPEVEEFIPASISNSASCVKQNGCQTMCNGDKKEIIISKDLKPSPWCNSKVETEKGFLDVDNETKINGHLAMPANNIKEMRETLKTKISNNANTNCVKSKREKNLAMASLLKLCLKAPEGKSNVIPSISSFTTDSQKQIKDPIKNDAPLKLLPPDYYETNINSEGIANGAPNSEKKNVATDKCKVIHEGKNVISSSTNLNSSKTNSNAATGMNVKASMTNVQSIDNEDIQHSVKKVENWLAGMSSEKVNNVIPDKNEPEKDKLITKSAHSTPKKDNKATGPPILFLGPVTFKRKEVVKSNSLSVTSGSTARNTPSTTYVPSAYASELSRSYNERAKAKKVIEDDIWSKLHTELDKRDEAYRTKMAETVSASESDVIQDDPISSDDTKL